MPKILPKPGELNSVGRAKTPANRAKVRAYNRGVNRDQDAQRRTRELMEKKDEK